MFFKKQHEYLCINIKFVIHSCIHKKIGCYFLSNLYFILAIITLSLLHPNATFAQSFECDQFGRVMVSEYNEETEMFETVEYFSDCAKSFAIPLTDEVHGRCDSCLCDTMLYDNSITTECDFLPDLVVSPYEAANDIRLGEVDTSLRLFVNASVANIGYGPFEVEQSGEGEDIVDGKQLIQQVIYQRRVDITETDTTCGMMFRKNTANGQTFSIYHSQHGHMHINNWVELTLRKRPTNGNMDASTWPLVAGGTKVSFCIISGRNCICQNPYLATDISDPVGIIDDDPNFWLASENTHQEIRDKYAKDLPSDYPNYRLGKNYEDCATTPGEFGFQGVSPGMADIYGSDLPGNFINIPCDLASGDYYIVLEVNPERLYEESNTSNNLAVVPYHFENPFDDPDMQIPYSGEIIEPEALRGEGDHIEWEGDEKVNGQLTIRNGKTLHIHEVNVEFVNNESGIVVEPGGTLILDGAYLTAISCLDHVAWKGIEVYGTGVVEVKNYAHITQAETAIKSIDGGTIIASNNALFYNNGLAIDISANTPQNNNSSFNDCFFSNNPDMLFDQNYDFVRLENVDGVTFERCRFTSGFERTNATPPHTGSNTGILATNSEVNISRFSEFIGLDVGVHVNSTGANLFNSTIIESDFKDCFIGIFTGGAYDVVTTNNFFSNNLVGIYARNNGGYNLAENTFSNCADGIIVDQTGPQNTQAIFANQFDGGRGAISALGNNAGMKFMCNDMSNMEYDFTLERYFNVDGEIFPIQGNIPEGQEVAAPDDPASNKFSENCLNNNTHIFTGSQTKAFTYVHHDPSLEPRYEPTCDDNANYDKRRLDVVCNPNCFPGDVPNGGDCFPTVVDQDNDNVPVGIDCDDTNSSIGGPGSPCNDGNSHTINDQQNFNCECVGTPKPPCYDYGGDADGDHICKDDDCNDKNDSIGGVGSACNDGDSETINDQRNSNCECVGTPKPPCHDNGGDTDGDGYCDDEDCYPYSPVSGGPGSPCNDYNSQTINDVRQEDCSCAGVPRCQGRGGDADGDGVCFDVDCDDNNAAIRSKGSYCNDNDVCTTGTRVQDDCSCGGGSVILNCGKPGCFAVYGNSNYPAYARLPVKYFCVQSVSTAILDLDIKLQAGNGHLLSTNISASPHNPLTWQTLQTASPYLSDQVLTDVVNQTLAPVEQAEAILVANAPLTQPVWDAIDNRPEPFPTSTLQHLSVIQNSGAISARQQLEWEIKNLEHHRGLMLSSLVRQAIAADDTEVAIDILAAEDGVTAKRWITALYIQEQSYDQAAVTLAEIPTDTEDQAQFVALQELNIALHSSGKTWTDMEEEEELVVRNIASSNTINAAYAQSVLRLTDDERFAAILPSRNQEEEGSNKATIDQLQFLPTHPQLIHIAPNPVEQEATIHIGLPPQAHAQTVLTLQVQDVTGRVVRQYEVLPNQAVLLDRAELTNGIYFCTLRQNQVILDQKKLLLLK